MDDALFWNGLAILTALECFGKYWYISLPLLGLATLNFLAAEYYRAKRKRTEALQVRRKREQQAWINHWVPLIDRQADLVEMYSALEISTTDAQQDILQGLNYYGRACVAVAKAEGLIP